MQVILLLLVLFVNTNTYSKPPRVVTIDETSIVPIYTALGYSTMLQFDSKPSSVILGDQDAFRAEFVGQSLTIKPIIGKGKTNLFVFTDYDRYNFQLINGPPSSVDYIVQVKRKSSRSISQPGFSEPSKKINSSVEDVPKEIKKSISKNTVCGPLKLSVESLRFPESNKWVLVDFSIQLTTSANNQFHFLGGDIDVTQNQKSLLIENLYFDSMLLSKQNSRIYGFAMIDLTLVQPNIAALRFSPDFLKRYKCQSAKVIIPSLIPPQRR